MSRLLAFSFFVSAAFDWPTLFVDRAGTAALGFAFLALIVGRTSSGLRPSLIDQARQVLGPPTPPVDPVTRELRDLIGIDLADE